MSYRALVNSNLNFAFNQLKDLAKDVILHKNTSAGFDFSNGEMTTTSTDISIKAVVIDDDKRSDKHNSIRRELLFKAEGLGDINQYSSVTIDSELWKFGSSLNNDGYTFLVPVYREI